MKEIFPIAEYGVVNRTTESFFRMHGWPSVCCDDRGVLYAVCSGFRMEHACPMGKNCMYVSFNEGKTWTPPIVVNDSYLDDRDTGILYLGDGKMLISFFSERDENNYKVFGDFDWMDEGRKSVILGMGKGISLLSDEEKKAGSFVRLSDDYGVTWSDRIDVPITAPHGPNVMKDGTIVYLGRADFTDDENDRHRILCYVSRDGGHTWEKRGTVPPCDGLHTDFVHEPHVVELPNGRLLGALRVHCRPAPMTPTNTVYTTFSDDGGFTWSEPHCIGVNGLPPHLFVHSSGAVICSYANRGDGTPNGGREERAAVSYDSGETWSEDYVLYANALGDMGYPATAELPDGSLITVYYQLYGREDYLSSILYTKWKLGDPDREEK